MVRLHYEGDSCEIHTKVANAIHHRQALFLDSGIAGLTVQELPGEVGNRVFFTLVIQLAQDGSDPDV